MDGGTTTAITETANTSCSDTQCGVEAKLALTPGRPHNAGRRSNESLLPVQDGHPRSTHSSPGPDASERSASPKMRRQMTIELPTNEPFEVLYDRKISVEEHSPSPKPCIVPGNALHLIDDDPSPRSQTPSSVIIIADGTEIHVDGSRSPAADHSGGDAGESGERSSSEPPPGARPQPRVRFRSRVRITSGVHRHRHSGTPAPQGQRRLSSGTPSSGSSPSSSISAPLRYQADENATWGPLGRRLSAFAAAGRRKSVQASPQDAEEGNGDGPGAHARPNERTALLRSSRHGGYVDPYDTHLSEGDEDDLEDELGVAELSRQKELVFGPWPERLLNLQWWWWHLEPIVCCTYCSEDSDYDE